MIKKKKVKEIEADIRHIIKKHGEFVSDMEADFYVKDISKLIYRQLERVPEMYTQKEYNLFYEQKLDIVEARFNKNIDDKLKPDIKIYR